MARMLLVMRGTGGDLFPFLRIGGALHRRGHEVTLFTHYGYQQQARNAGLEFVALDQRDELSQILQDQALLMHPPALLTFCRRHIIPKIAAECRMLQAQCQPDTTVIVAHLNSYIVTKLVSEALNIPLVTIFTAPMFLQTLPVLVEMYRALAPEINRERSQLGLAPVRDWRAWGQKATRSLAFWPDWFHATESPGSAGVVPVGFVSGAEEATAEIPPTAEAFLREGAPPILIAHGTGMPAAKSFFTSSVEACRMLGRRGLLVTRFEEFVPADLPPSVHTVDYLPFDSIMSALQLIIHHGGIGTIAQALAAGVPQLILAKGDDRPDNAMQVQQLGVGRYLPPEQWQPQSVAQAIQELSESADVQARCAELSCRCQLSEPMAAICTTIEECLPASRAVGAAPTPPIPADTQKNSALHERLAKLSPEQREYLKARLGLKQQTQNSADE